jgi:alanine dehydrogenase
MIVCSDAQIDRLLPMPEAMPAVVERIETVYRQWGEGRAINQPRTDVVSPDGPGVFYNFKSMAGSAPGIGFAALRTNSQRMAWNPGGGGTTKRVDQSAGSLIFLFEIASGHLVAILADEELQRMRVGATCAVAARRLAPAGPLRMALLGSAGQARFHLYAMVSTLNVSQVDVFSPDAAHAEALVDTVSPRVGCPVRRAASAEEAVRGADLVVSATNAVTPTLRADWLKPGCLVTCVKAAELGEEVLGAMDRVVVHAHKGYVDNYLVGHGDEPFEATDPVHLLGVMPRTDPEVDFRAHPMLKDVLAGREPGRRSAAERTCFLNNVGLGLQFAAIGSLAYERARATGIGQDVALAIEPGSGVG